MAIASSRMEPGEANVFFFFNPFSEAVLRVALRRIRQSGMSDLLKRYSFQSYRAETPEQKNILDKARQFAGSDGGWFCAALGYSF